MLGACSGAPPPSEAQPTPAPDDPLFGPREDRGPVAHDALREASGLVAGRRNPGLLWTHNDSGDAARLFALGPHGEHLGMVHLEGVSARDWEDLAIGPGPTPGRAYLYVADIGDNLRQYDAVFIHRFSEPLLPTRTPPLDTTLTDVETLVLRYPDGPHDAETLMADPGTGDLYLVTKRSTTVRVYRAPFPQPADTPTTLEPVTALTLPRVPGAGDDAQGAVAGDIAPDGRSILLKTYTHVLLWERPDPEAPLFSGAPRMLPYTPEPQGEAIAWASDGRGYYTVSEERNNIPARLYFYPKRIP